MLAQWLRERDQRKREERSRKHGMRFTKVGRPGTSDCRPPSERACRSTNLLPVKRMKGQRVNLKPDENLKIGMRPTLRIFGDSLMGVPDAS